MRGVPNKIDGTEVRKYLLNAVAQGAITDTEIRGIVTDAQSMMGIVTKATAIENDLMLKWLKTREPGQDLVAAARNIKQEAWRTVANGWNNQFPGLRIVRTFRGDIRIVEDIQKKE